MDRVFLDANVLFSAAYRRDAGLQRLWRVPHIELLTSDFAREEARRNLLKPSQRGRLTRLLRNVDIIPEPEDRPLPRGIDLPDKDRPIFLAALAGKSSHLLTGDIHHFGQYFGQTTAGILILPPAKYLEGREKRK